MPIAGAKYRVRTYPNGKRVRLTIVGNRVVETKELPRIHATKTRKSLKRRRRRIGR